MTIPVQKPLIPEPPAEYDPEYFKNMIKQLDVFFNRLNAAGVLQGTTLNLSKLPTSATGLKAGDLWNDAGIVKIV